MSLGPSPILDLAAIAPLMTAVLSIAHEVRVPAQLNVNAFALCYYVSRQVIKGGV